MTSEQSREKGREAPDLGKEDRQLSPITKKKREGKGENIKPGPEQASGRSNSRRRQGERDCVRWTSKLEIEHRSPGKVYRPRNIARRQTIDETNPKRSTVLKNPGGITSQTSRRGPCSKNEASKENRLKRKENTEPQILRENQGAGDRQGTKRKNRNPGCPYSSKKRHLHPMRARRRADKQVWKVRMSTRLTEGSREGTGAWSCGLTTRLTGEKLRFVELLQVRRKRRGDKKGLIPVGGKEDPGQRNHPGSKKETQPGKNKKRGLFHQQGKTTVQGKEAESSGRVGEKGLQTKSAPATSRDA